MNHPSGRNWAGEGGVGQCPLQVTLEGQPGGRFEAKEEGQTACKSNSQAGWPSKFRITGLATLSHEGQSNIPSRGVKNVVMRFEN